MTEAQLALMSDTRLSSRARFVGVFISALDSPSEHGPEIPSDLFESLFGHSWDVLRRDVKALEKAGWIERKTQTGKGHSPAYRFLDHAKTPPYQDLRCAFLHTLSDSLGGSVVLKDFSIGGTVVLNDTVVVDDKEVVVVGERAREKSEDEILVGCRGSLRDYLAGSVPPPRQYQYVQTLIGWLGGTDASVWKKPDGSSVAPEKRTALLAAALNELGASDETKYKRPVGDPANLKTKMNVILRQAYQPSRDGGGRNLDKSKTNTQDPDRWKKGAIDGSFL